MTALRSQTASEYAAPGQAESTSAHQAAPMVMLRMMRDPAYICDADGFILDFNAAAAELWGRKPAAHDDSDKYCGGHKRFSLDGAPMARDGCPAAKALKHGKNVKCEDILIERPDGVRRMVRVSASLALNETSGPISVIVVMQDLSERKAAARIFANAFTACEQIFANQNFPLGELSIKLDSQCYDQHLNLLKAHKDANTPLSQLTILNAMIEQIQLRNRAIHEAGFRQNQEYKAAIQTQTKFLLNVAHGMRSALDLIIGYGDMLREEFEESGHHGVVADAQGIVASARRLLLTANDLIDFARLSEPEADYAGKDFDAALLIREVMGSIATYAADSGCALELKLNSDLGLGFGDAPKIKRCLFNLVTHAIKASGGGLITISGERAPHDGEDWFLFNVADSGEGLSLDEQAKHIRPFNDGELALENKDLGSIVGLGVAQRLIRLLGGGIELTISPGQGTTAHMRVRAVSAPPEAA